MNPIPTGIELGGEVGGDRFKDLIVRRNIIRDVNQPVGDTDGLLGLQLTSYTRGVVENNIIDNIATPSAFYFSGPDLTLRSFNNRSSSGKLLRAWNPSTTLYKQELTDEVQTALIPLASRRLAL